MITICIVFVYQPTKSKRRTFFTLDNDVDIEPVPSPKQEKPQEATLQPIPTGVVTLPTSTDEEEPMEAKQEGQRPVIGQEDDDEDTEPVTRVTGSDNSKPPPVSMLTPPRTPPPPPPKKRFTARKMEPAVLLEVEVDGQVQSLTFSRDANTTEVATGFCVTHDMAGAECVTAVEELIKANTGSASGLNVGATHVMA